MDKARPRPAWPVPRTRKPKAWPAMRAANRRPTNQGWWRLANSRRREPRSRSKLTAVDIFGGRHSASWLRSAEALQEFNLLLFRLSFRLERADGMTFVIAEREKRVA